MKNRAVKILIGIPGSGKTTWADEFLSKNPDWMKVGRDDFRFMLRNQAFLDFKAENMITDMVVQTARKALLTGYNVIIDNTNCRLSYINKMVEALGDLADIDYRYYDTPLDTCVERDSKREKKFGETVIKKMHKDLVIMLDSFDFQARKKSERIRLDYSKAWKKDLPDAVIFDVDGTLAHFGTKRGPFDWKKVGVDDVDKVVARQLKMHKAYGDTILIVSGRDGSCRQETIDWLELHELEHDALFMRPAGDFRKDSLIKKEIFENDIKDKYNVIAVYDDRDQVVETWRSLGLKCFQVEYGEF